MEEGREKERRNETEDHFLGYLMTMFQLQTL
jgi:hypothetical protein